MVLCTYFVPGLFSELGLLVNKPLQENISALKNSYIFHLMEGEMDSKNQAKKKKI
jgi:hypothetical protein